MLLKPLSIAAAGLAVASAFLIPPEINAIEIPELMNPFQSVAQTIDVPCPGCLVIVDIDTRAKASKDVPNHLRLRFNVENNRLVVNNFEIFPKVNPHHSLVAPQIIDAQEDSVDVQLRKHQRPNFPEGALLGYGLRLHPEGVDKATGFSVIGIDLQIIEVGPTFISDIPNVHVKLIKAADGSLIIGSIETTPSRTHGASYKSKMAKCSNFICRWRVAVAAHMAHLKPHTCAMMGKFGHKGHKGHPHAGAHPVAHPHHPHHHHGAKPNAWEGHTWHKLVKQLVKYVLYPIVLGMIVGVGVCVIGMSVGTIVVACWRIFVRRQTPAAAFGNSPFHRRCRRHRRSSRAHKAANAEVAVSEEKSSLIENLQEAPPSYIDEEIKKTEA